MNQIRSNDQVAVQGIAGHDERVVNKRRRICGVFRLGVGALLLTGAFLFSMSAEAQVKKQAVQKPQMVDKERIQAKDPTAGAIQNRITIKRIKLDRNKLKEILHQGGKGSSSSTDSKSSSSSASSNSTASVPAAVVQKRNEIRKWNEVVKDKYYKATEAMKYKDGQKACPTMEDVKRLFNGAVVEMGTYKGKEGWFVAACEEDLKDAIVRASTTNANLPPTYLFVAAYGYKNGSELMSNDYQGFYWTSTKDGNNQYYFWIDRNKNEVVFVKGDANETVFTFSILPIKK